jgi:hypothetical protein
MQCVQPLDCWGRGFESHWGYSCVTSLVFVVAAFASSWSLVQGSQTGCVSLIVCDIWTTTMRRLRPDLGCWATEKEVCTVKLHLSGSWLSGSPITRIGLALRVNIFLLNYTTCFYGLNFSPNCQIRIKNYVLMFYLYVNEYVAWNSCL